MIHNIIHAVNVPIDRLDAVPRESRHRRSIAEAASRHRAGESIPNAGLFIPPDHRMSARTSMSSPRG